MAYFHCLIGSGSSGGGYELTVTCDADFAGTTITCTDGVTTLTQTCPSASPYEVVFEIPNGGTWTVSGIVSGSTCTASIDIPDELELTAIPDGSTVTPTDVIQTWLKCGGIFDKSYTTLNEVLADSTTLLALISDDNASDYLVRSTTWASGIIADSTAMTDIGANNYCADTLLADSTWLAAICGSTYFESVLNVKVPTMTSDTTPSGAASASNVFGGQQAYYAFDKSLSSAWQAQNVPNWIAYEFSSDVSIYYVTLTTSHLNNTPGPKESKIQYSQDGSSWFDINDDADFVDCPSAPLITYSKTYINNISAKHFRLYISDTNYIYQGNKYIAIEELQFYGREDV